MDKFTFNTGRGYTPEGQLITVQYDANDRALYFTDHSRHIAGWVPCTREYTQVEMARHVMFLYDNGNYDMPGRWNEQCEIVEDYALEINHP